MIKNDDNKNIMEREKYTVKSAGVPLFRNLSNIWHFKDRVRNGLANGAWNGVRNGVGNVIIDRDGFDRTCPGCPPRDSGMGWNDVRKVWRSNGRQSAKWKVSWRNLIRGWMRGLTSLNGHSRSMIRATINWEIYLNHSIYSPRAHSRLFALSPQDRQANASQTDVHPYLRKSIQRFKCQHTQTQCTGILSDSHDLAWIWSADNSVLMGKPPETTTIHQG
jgi:hypothetical protein